MSQDIGPGEDGEYREAYEGADIVFPGANEDIVRVVPKTAATQSLIDKTLEALEKGGGSMNYKKLAEPVPQPEYEQHEQPIPPQGEQLELDLDLPGQQLTLWRE